ncbi:MAG TPA: HAD-IIIC family phosphatase [Bryobacteraceae bacterium]|nr:HAD-IIIC family phosphatase [Bryobacteraceae bacterium]
MQCEDQRQQIDGLLAAGRWRKAAHALESLWNREGTPTPSLASFLISRYEKLRDHLDFIRHHCVILRSFTVEPVMPLLRACAFTSGIDLSVKPGEFNSYVQELLDPGSFLYTTSPDTVVLAVQTRDLAPELWRDYSGLDADARQASVKRITQEYESWVQTFRSRSQANLIVHTLAAPPVASQGVYDSQQEEGQATAIQEINRHLRLVARAHRGVYVLDYDALVARHGREEWGDERKWLAVRLPIAARNLPHLAREWMRFLTPLSGRIAKAVAVDLDNTLWGGVIGEDGMAGIQLGTEYPGAAYQELQRTLLDLWRRGILLAICSKNNPADALEALGGHPGMLLKPEHFAAQRINWNEKGQNLREIASELNIGLDAIAFLDDNPVERQQVREQAPEAMVIELPSDPMLFARAVRDFAGFERLSLSKEDRERGRYYAAERQRTQLEATATSREDFYRSLQQEVEIAPVNSLTLARVAQLTQKTNQFNLSTKRYTEQQIAEMSRTGGWLVYSLKVRDRYSDNGLVGVAITWDHDGTCEIDTFLMSCRVIGRTVETALLAQLACEARARGAKRLEGWYLPTKKNAPARDFYAAHGFQLREEKEGGQFWSLDLTTAELRYPEWVRLITHQTETA